MSQRVAFILLLLVLTQSSLLRAQSQNPTLWVGEPWTMESAQIDHPNGPPFNIQWTTSKPDCLKLEPSGYQSCKVTPIKYFSGTETVTITYDYYNEVGATSHYSLTRYFSCKDNPVTVSPTSTTLVIGSTLKLSYSHQNNDYADAASVTFTSSNTTVATVSNTGRITAKKPGTALVYVHSTLANDENAPYCEVTVSPPTVVLPKTMTLNIGENEKIIPTQSPGSSFTLTWKSSNTSIATVSSSGRVTAKNAGDVRITATVTGYEDYEVSSDYCDVTVTDYPTGITLPQDSVTLAIGQTYTITPTVTPTGAVYQLTWSSHDKNVAKVNSNGIVTAMGIGTTYITIKAASTKDPNKKVYAYLYVTVVDVLRGDVNNDSKVSIDDVTALIRFLLTSDSSGINLNNADVDGDGNVNISDLTALIRKLLAS